MTTFHMVRHGLIDAPHGVLNGRRPGVHLLPEGRRQAERAAEKLAGEPVHAIFTSPLERTQETAALIADRLGLQPYLEPALLEVAYGDWTGEAYAEFDPAGPWPRYNSFRSGTRIPGGELMLETQSRIVCWMLQQQSQRPDETLVIVSHGDVIRSALVYFLGMPIDLMLRVEITQGSITTLQIDRDGAKALKINWTDEAGNPRSLKPSAARR